MNRGISTDKEDERIKIQVYADYCHTDFTFRSTLIVSALVGMLLVTMGLTYQGQLPLLGYYGSLAAIVIFIVYFMRGLFNEYHNNLDQIEGFFNKLEKNEPLPTLKEMRKGSDKKVSEDTSTEYGTQIKKLIADVDAVRHDFLDILFRGVPEIGLLGVLLLVMVMVESLKVATETYVALLIASGALASSLIVYYSAFYPKWDETFSEYKARKMCKSLGYDRGETKVLLTDSSCHEV